MPSVTLHPPGTAVPRVEGGGGGVMVGSECLAGLRMWTIGRRWVGAGAGGGSDRRRKGGGDRITATASCFQSC